MLLILPAWNGLFPPVTLPRFSLQLIVYDLLNEGPPYQARIHWVSHDIWKFADPVVGPMIWALFLVMEVSLCNCVVKFTWTWLAVYLLNC